jgi:very-short-patch-repair endonuclease
MADNNEVVAITDSFSAPASSGSLVMTSESDSSGENPSALDLAEFLKEVYTLNVRQRTTIASQTANGFVLWCHEWNSPLTISPSKTGSLVLEVKKPSEEPCVPPQNSSPEELAAHSEKYAIWAKHDKTYRLLHSSCQVADGMELVLATALCTGKTQKGIDFERHVIAAPVVVNINHDDGLLTVTVAGDRSLEQHWMSADFFEKMTSVAGTNERILDAHSIADLDAGLAALCNNLGPDYLHLPMQFLRPPGGLITTISAAPCILLRERESSAVQRLLAMMVEDIKANPSNVSNAFKSLVQPFSVKTVKAATNVDDVALALPADSRQREIISKALQNTHVVIQGPPGTGKTHTIANMLSALLADGKRVMVTAENERALSEVQAKMPVNMRHLLVPLFRSSGDRSLAASVNGIKNRVHSESIDEQNDRIAELETQWSALKQQVLSKLEILHQRAVAEGAVRSIEGVDLTLAGHIALLLSRAEQLDAASEYLSTSGRIAPDDAAEFLRLRSEITPLHEADAEKSTPTTPATAAEAQQKFSEIDEELKRLPIAKEENYANLVEMNKPLEQLAKVLATLPPVGWEEISQEVQVYKDAAEDARHHGAHVLHDISHSGGSPLRSEEEITAAINVLEKLSDVAVDDMTQGELLKLRGSLTWDASVPVNSSIRSSDLWPLWSNCSTALTAIYADRTGQLDSYVLSCATNSVSSLTKVVVNAEAMITSLGATAFPNMTIAPGSPSSEVLLGQANTLIEYLESGRKMKRTMRGAHPSVKAADQLLTYLLVNGSKITALSQVQSARSWLEYQIKLAKLRDYLKNNGLHIPKDMSLSAWLENLARFPEKAADLVATIKEAIDARGSDYALPATATSLLLDTRHAAAAAMMPSLDELARAAESCVVEVLQDGKPIRGKNQARVVADSLKSKKTVMARARLLPESWRAQLTHHGIENEQLAHLLEIASQAAQVPGWARNPTLSMQSVEELRVTAHTESRRKLLGIARREVASDIADKLRTTDTPSFGTLAAQKAAKEEDWDQYREACLTIEEERARKQSVKKYQKLRLLVQEQHPNLAIGLEKDLEDALKCISEIESYEKLLKRSLAVSELRDDLDEQGATRLELADLHNKCRRVEEELSERRCWINVSKRLADDLELSSALSALEIAFKQILKSKTAKLYDAKIANVQQLARAAAPAIPAWVLTIDRAAELLGYPAKDARFDVIIIDEASQAWFPTMFLYALADQVIVVGDDLQTSPAVNSGAETQIGTLAKEKLGSKHRFTGLVDDSCSLYDTASSITNADLLVDHFRCLPEIIDISMRLSYEPQGKHLKPVRTGGPKGLPPVKRVRVNGSRKTKESPNMPEVDALVAKLLECHSDARYDDKTFGVVVVGSNPGSHIVELHRRLLTVLGSKMLDLRNLEIGTASQFQGAERDVMFLSLLDVLDEDGKVRKKPQAHSGKNKRYVQQLNVATSRARDQLWIFHSLDAGHLDASEEPDARLVLLAGGSAPQSVAPLIQFGSSFEEDVYNQLKLHAPDLSLTTQVSAAGYSIDIVAEGIDGRRLAIECDGDRWHSGAEKVKADLYRQRLLEDLGWEFYRFFASEWFANPTTHIRHILGHFGLTYHKSKVNVTPTTRSLFANEDIIPEAFLPEEIQIDWAGANTAAPSASLGRHELLGDLE